MMSKIKEIQLRRAVISDAEAIAAVRIEGWQTSYRGMIPDSYLDTMSLEENVEQWRTILQALPTNEQNLRVYVAVSGDEIIGFISMVKLSEPKLGRDGEINAIYIRPQWQRCGIGKRMMHKAARSLQEMGCGSCVIWVIDGNSVARNFYEELGGQILVEQDFTWDGLDLTEVGYGWDDLSVLLASADAMPFPRAMQ